MKLILENINGILGIVTSILVFALFLVVLLNKMVSKSIAYHSSKLFIAAKKTDSPIMMVAYDKQNNKIIYAIEGDEHLLMKKIVLCEKKYPDFSEFLQIISTYYNTDSKHNLTTVKK
tara:strand:- start:511 stop:861 length:351 start_codon:yes stop_codon:yes gene_type:complete